MRKSLWPSGVTPRRLLYKPLQPDTLNAMGGRRERVFWHHGRPGVLSVEVYNMQGYRHCEDLLAMQDMGIKRYNMVTGEMAGDSCPVEGRPVI